MNLIGYSICLNLSILNFWQKKISEKWRNIKQNGVCSNCFKIWKSHNSRYWAYLNTINEPVKLCGKSIELMIDDSARWKVKAKFFQCFHNLTWRNRATDCRRRFWWTQKIFFCTLKFEAEIWIKLLDHVLRYTAIIFGIRFVKIHARNAELDKCQFEKEIFEEVGWYFFEKFHYLSLIQKLGGNAQHWLRIFIFCQNFKMVKETAQTKVFSSEIHEYLKHR